MFDSTLTPILELLNDFNREAAMKSNLTLKLKIAFVLFLTLSQNAYVFAQSTANPFIGIWSGKAITKAENTKLELHISELAGKITVEMTLPDVGVTGWPANYAEVKSNVLTVTFMSDSGVQKMKLTLDDKTLKGSWQEPRFNEDSVIELLLPPKAESVTEQRILIEGPTGKLGASLFLPNCNTRCPGAVFLHGSGPQPRDSSRFAAQTFAEHGIASIIFDKRGVAESEGELAGVTFDGLAADGIAIAEYLLSQSKVSKVGFFGHSQGGWIGPLAGSKWSKTAFVISSAGPAVSPSREAQWDVVRKMRLAAEDKAEIDAAIHIIELWHGSIRSANWQTFDAALNSTSKKPWFAKSGLAYFTKPNHDFVKSYRAFMDHNPITALKQLNSPLMSILTHDDESIDSVETLKILSNMIADGQDIQLKYYQGYDHSLRKLNVGGQLLRWPEHPHDYFSSQAAFIHDVVGE